MQEKAVSRSLDYLLTYKRVQIYHYTLLKQAISLYQRIVNRLIDCCNPKISSDKSFDAFVTI